MQRADLAIVNEAGSVFFYSRVDRSPAPLRTAFPVGALTIAMIETALGAVLVTTIGAPPLFAKGEKTTVRAAITLAAITGAANAENRVASTAHSLPKNSLALIRHPGRQVGLDKDDSSWQGKTIRCLSDGYLTRMPSWDPTVTSGGIPESFFHLLRTTYITA